MDALCEGRGRFLSLEICVKQKESPSATAALVKGALYTGLNLAGLCPAEIQFLEVPEVGNLQDSTLWQQERLNLIHKIK